MSTAATPFNGVVVAIQIVFLGLDRLPMLETCEEARRLAEINLLVFNSCHVFFQSGNRLFWALIILVNFGREKYTAHRAIQNRSKLVLVV